jgi:hypothetical protein
VLDGSATNIARFKNSYYYWRYQIQAVDAFITKDNINNLLARSGFDQDLGILSVDLDGNDYYVLDAISEYRPRILICEYNSVFGPDRTISVPYDPGFVRTEKHYSYLYYGCSLAALVHLGAKKGYSLVGNNSAFGNAFFVRNDLLNDRLEVLTASQAYLPSNFRESRDVAGKLTYAAGEDRLKIIQGLPVVNVESGSIETL